MIMLQMIILNNNQRYNLSSQVNDNSVMIMYTAKKRENHFNAKCKIFPKALLHNFII